jgi:hypothetical protein
MTLQEFFGEFYPIVESILNKDKKRFHNLYFELIDKYRYKRAKEIMDTIHAILVLLEYSE